MAKDQQVHCQIRREWVAASPEELVRQRLLHSMIHELGFPSSLIVVEKAIQQLPHLAATNPKNIPDRRIDIMCYASGVQPLLVVECKAVALTWRVISQVLGYNQVIRSPFVSIANETEVRTGWFDQNQQRWVFIEHLPSYQELSRGLA
jgi:hypothetical protein